MYLVKRSKLNVQLHFTTLHASRQLLFRFQMSIIIKGPSVILEVFNLKSQMSGKRHIH